VFHRLHRKSQINVAGNSLRIHPLAVDHKNPLIYRRVKPAVVGVPFQRLRRKPRINVMRKSQQILLLVAVNYLFFDTAAILPL